MKYLKLICFIYTLFICLFICQFANAETYYVNTEVLNLRSCEGTNCKILGKLISGESVDVIEDKGEWVKVKTDKGEGFVIKRSLLNGNSGEYSPWVIWIILAISLLAWFLPSVIASNNVNHRKIFWVNLLIGWIPIIWLILLIAALVGEKRKEEEIWL